MSNNTITSITTSVEEMYKCETREIGMEMEIQNRPSSSLKSGSEINEININIDRLSEFSPTPSNYCKSPTNVIYNPNALTTTISTIALQSGTIRFVIALLQSRSILEIRIIEMFPQFTYLGTSLKEAESMLGNHKDVLNKLQGKHGPVEKLMRLADELILQQKPRPEVHQAMAESLSLAWKDLNSQLEQRRKLIENNVHFFRDYEDCYSRIKDLENESKKESGEILPLCKERLAGIKKKKMGMLASLNRTLEQGQILMGDLANISEENIDSRPHFLKLHAEYSITQVKRWLEKLHDRRQIVEDALKNCSESLREQIQIHQFDKDVTDVEDRMKNLEIPSTFGESVENVKELIVLVEKALQIVHNFQEELIQLMRKFEKTRFKHWPVHNSKSRCFALLDSLNQLAENLETFKGALDSTLEFFLAALQAHGKLDELEKSEEKILSTLGKNILNELTFPALSKGEVLLDRFGWAVKKTHGIRVVHDELISRKESMRNLKEELFKSSKLNEYLTELNSLYTLVSEIELWSQKRISLAPNEEVVLKLSQELSVQRERMQRAAELNPILQKSLHFDPNLHGPDVGQKTQLLFDKWTRLIKLLQDRAELVGKFQQFLQKSKQVKNEFLDPAFDYTGDLQLVECLAQDFLDSAQKAKNLDPNLSCGEAVEYTQSEVQNLRGKFREMEKELQNKIKRESIMESVQLMSKRVKDLKKEAFPLLPENKSSDTKFGILYVNSKKCVVEKAKKIANEMEEILQIMEAKGEDQTSLKQLKAEHTIVRDFIDNYETLTSLIVSLYQTMLEIDDRISEMYNIHCGSLPEIDLMERGHEKIHQNATYLLKSCEEESSRIVQLMKDKEPPLAASIDEARLLACVRTKEELWENFSSTQMDKFEKMRSDILNRDFHEINSKLKDLLVHLGQTRGQYGESELAARENSNAFEKFENTLEILHEKVSHFVETTRSLGDNLPDLPEKRTELQWKMAALRQQAKERRRVINLTLEYFKCVTEAKQWILDGLNLVESSKKSLDVGRILKFLDDGELEQDERIQRVAQISSQLYGVEKSQVYQGAIKLENEKMLELLKQLRKDFPPEESQSQSQQNTILEKVILSTNYPSSSEKYTTGVSSTEKSEPSSTTSGKIVHFNNQVLVQVQIETLKNGQVESGSKLGSHQQEVVKIKEQFGEPITNTTTVTESKIMLEKETQIEPKIGQERNTQTLIPIVVSSQNRALEVGSQTSSAATDQPTESESEINKLRREIQIESSGETRGNLISAPSFTAPLKDTAIFEGEKLHLECRVVGSPDLTITWLKNSIPVDSHSNPEYKTETNITPSDQSCHLTIEQVQVKSHTSIITCRAQNPVGIAETTCKLVVMEKIHRSTDTDTDQLPQFVEKLPESQTFLEGSSGLIQCLVQGTPLPNVFWFKDGQSIDEHPQFVSTFNNGRCSLHFDNIRPHFKGTFCCKSMNIHGSTETWCKVDVQEIVKIEPKFNPGLVDTVVKVGEKVKFEAKVWGEPDLKVHWYLNDQKIENISPFKLKFDGSWAKLSLKDVSIKHAGRYCILAKGPSGGESKSFCNLTVKEMEIIRPKIISGLQNLTVRVGEEFILQAIIKAHPEPEVIWYRSEVPIKETKDFQLLFQGDKCLLIVKQAYLEDSADYRIEAVNSGGSASSTCHVTVLEKERTTEPPRFEQMIQDTMVNMGEEVVFTCKLSEVWPRPEVTWFKNAQRLNKEDGYEIIEEGSIYKLRIPTSTTNHRGNYMVKATTHGVGEIKCFASLIVKGETGLFEGEVSSPKRVMSPISILKQRSESIGEKTPPPLSPKLFDDQLENSNKSYKEKKAIFERKDSLSQSSESESLTFARPSRTKSSPKFLCPVQSVMADEGTYVTLEGMVDGCPEPNISWTKNDVPIEFLQSSYKHGKVALQIGKVKIQDGGRYCCIAESESGIATSVADVIVKKTTFPPVFGKRLRAQTVPPNKRIYMEVEVIATPAPVVTWWKDGRQLESGGKFVIKEEENRHILIINDAKPINSGQYTVKAYNEAGEAQSISDIVVLEDSTHYPLDSGLSQVTFESKIGIGQNDISGDRQQSLVYKTTQQQQQQHEITRTTILSSTSSSGQQQIKSGSNFQRKVITSVPLLPASAESLTSPPKICVTPTSLNASLDEKPPTSPPFNLKPEPPPEFCYTPKPEFIRSTSVKEKAKTFENIPQSDIAGGVRTLPPALLPPPPLCSRELSLSPTIVKPIQSQITHFQPQPLQQQQQQQQNEPELENYFYFANQPKEILSPCEVRPRPSSIQFPLMTPSKFIPGKFSSESEQNLRKDDDFHIPIKWVPKSKSESFQTQSQSQPQYQFQEGTVEGGSAFAGISPYKRDELLKANGNEKVEQISQTQTTQQNWQQQQQPQSQPQFQSQNNFLGVGRGRKAASLSPTPRSLYHSSYSTDQNQSQISPTAIAMDKLWSRKEIHTRINSNWPPPSVQDQSSLRDEQTRSPFKTGKVISEPEPTHQQQYESQSQDKEPVQYYISTVSQPSVVVNPLASTVVNPLPSTEIQEFRSYSSLSSSYQETSSTFSKEIPTRPTVTTTVAPIVPPRLNKNNIKSETHHWHSPPQQQTTTTRTGQFTQNNFSTGDNSIINLQPGPKPEFGFQPRPRDFIDEQEGPQNQNLCRFADHELSPGRSSSPRKIKIFEESNNYSHTKSMRLEDEENFSPFIQKRKSQTPPRIIPRKFIPGGGGDFSGGESDYASASDDLQQEFRLKPKWTPRSSVRESSSETETDTEKSPSAYFRRVVPPSTSNAIKRYSLGSSESDSGIQDKFGMYMRSRVGEASERFSRELEPVTDLVLRDSATHNFIKGDENNDPNSTLVYFKYDFGYEFGCVAPEKERTSPSPRPLSPGSRQIPIIHEPPTTSSTSVSESELPQHQRGLIPKKKNKSVSFLE